MKLIKGMEFYIALGIILFIVVGTAYMYSIDPTKGNVFVYQIINGLQTGCCYALIAFGLSLVWGIMNLCNFAHGDFYTLGAYLALWFSYAVGLPIIISVIITLVVCYIIGMMLERGLLRPAQYVVNPQFAWIITFGLSLFMENLFLNVFGPFPVKPPSLVTGTISILGIGYSLERVLAGTVGLIAVITIYIMLKFTWYGRSLRAVVQDREAAALLGVDISKVFYLSFGFGIMLSALGGILMGPYLLIDPLSGFRPGLKAFVIVVLGGMGSLKGSLIGGILLGIIESLGAAYIAPGYQDAFGFLLLVLTLVFKPEGLFGKEL